MCSLVTIIVCLLGKGQKHPKTSAIKTRSCGSERFVVKVLFPPFCRLRKKRHLCCMSWGSIYRSAASKAAKVEFRTRCIQGWVEVLSLQCFHGKIWHEVVFGSSGTRLTSRQTFIFRVDPILFDIVVVLFKSSGSTTKAVVPDWDPLPDISLETTIVSKSKYRR